MCPFLTFTLTPTTPDLACLMSSNLCLVAKQEHPLDEHRAVVPAVVAVGRGHRHHAAVAAACRLRVVAARRDREAQAELPAVAHRLDLIVELDADRDVRLGLVRIRRRD